tara:strand:+ start:485 stop:2119 length:1635 start_codon:yes stop_codon:yes gene_type:complete
MNRDNIEKAINQHYESGKMSFQQLLEIVERQYSQFMQHRELFEKNAPASPPTDIKAKKNILLQLPIIRLSEKEWGKEGTRDREVVQNLLQKIVGQGQTLAEKVRLVSNFVQSPPQTEDISEVLSHLVLLDTLTNIMVHFNASAAGFTFEGFLAALLEGQQVPAGTAGIQDIIDNDKNPVSLKLLTEAGSASVEGSYKDLCDHFIDPGGLKQDPDSEQHLARSGAGGGMTYVVALKSFREKSAHAALTGDEAQTIRFYQFEFDAENFLDAMRSNSHNARLLLLPSDIPDDPSDDPASTSAGVGKGEFQVEEFILTNFTQEDYTMLKSEYKNKLKILAAKYDTDYARDLFSKMEIVPIEGSKKLKLVWRETGKEFARPRTDTKNQLPWEPPHGSEHLKNIGATSHESYLDFRSSVRKLESALSGPEGAAAFWKLISLSLGYAGGVKGVTQFEIKREYYERKSFNKDGLGFIGQIPVGRAAVTQLAEKYVDVLNNQIFELFSRVEKLTNEINAYFVGGDRDQGLEAARTAGQIEKRQRKYVTGAEET